MSALKVSVITLFPELIYSVLSSSITGRALKQGLYELNLLNLRDFGQGSYQQVDDRLYGGGKGMLIQCEPVFQAWLQATGADVDTILDSVACSEFLKSEGIRTIFLSPKGKTFEQKTAIDFAKYKHLIFLCGHYEGIDTRVLKKLQVEPYSLGDFVLTGGEIPATAMIDATLRMIPRVLKDSIAYEHESHYQGLLEEDAYTMPANWRGEAVPKYLLSGHHKLIESKRNQDAYSQTFQARPDMGNALDFMAPKFTEYLNNTFDSSFLEKEILNFERIPLEEGHF